MLTFKAHISSLEVISIYSKPFADTVFTFSKRRIFFTEAQLDTYKFHLGDCRLLHQTEYTLKTIYDKNDKLQYQINIGQNCTAILKLEWFNLFKLKIIHDLIKIPKWIKTIINKVFEKGLDALILIATAYISYQLGISNGQLNTKSNTPIAAQALDTTTLQKKVILHDTGNAYKNTDTSRYFP